MRIRLDFVADRIPEELYRIANEIREGRTFGVGWTITEDDALWCQYRNSDGQCKMTKPVATLKSLN